MYHSSLVIGALHRFAHRCVSLCPTLHFTSIIAVGCPSICANFMSPSLMATFQRGSLFVPNSVHTLNFVKRWGRHSLSPLINERPSYHIIVEYTGSKLGPLCPLRRTDIPLLGDFVFWYTLVPLHPLTYTVDMAACYLPGPMTKFANKKPRGMNI